MCRWAEDNPVEIFFNKRGSKESPVKVGVAFGDRCVTRVYDPYQGFDGHMVFPVEFEEGVDGKLVCEQLPHAVRLTLVDATL